MSTSLTLISAYIKAFGEIPHNPSELVEYSDGKLNYLEAQTIIDVYRKNLNAFRSGKVSYCTRTRAVSYSAHLTPHKNIRSIRSDNDTVSVASNISNVSDSENNIKTHYSIRSHTNTITSVDTESDRGINKLDNCNPTAQNAHNASKKGINDKNECNDSDNEYKDIEKILNEYAGVYNENDLSEKTYVSVYNPNESDFESKSADDNTENDCGNGFINMEPVYKQGKAKKKRKKLKIQKDLNSIEKDQPKGIWGTIWSLFRPPSTTCSCAINKC